MTKTLALAALTAWAGCSGGDCVPSTEVHDVAADGGSASGDCTTLCAAADPSWNQTGCPSKGKADYTCSFVTDDMGAPAVACNTFVYRTAISE